MDFQALKENKLCYIALILGVQKVSNGVGILIQGSSVRVTQLRSVV